MRIGIAQVNPWVGDVDRNKDLIIKYLTLGREQHNLDLLVFPELMLTGYPPEDLLYRPALYRKISDALDSIQNSARNIKLLLGYPRKSDNFIYNSCAFISNGELITTYDKIELPNYGVFDEKRYFRAGSRPCVIDINGIRIAPSICEDIWSPEPAMLAKKAGADVLININASPFHIHKATDRRATLAARHRETGLPIIYTNLVGGQDELVFDGGSMVMDTEGKLVLQAPEFEEGLYITEMSLDTANRIRFNVITPQSSLPEFEQSVYSALVLAVRDYVRKNGFKSVVIGLSGGIDSALVTCVAADALGAENVEVLLMPSRYTADISIEDALELAANLGIKYHVISIEPPFSAFTDLLKPIFGDLPVDSTEENIQARCRSVLLMAVSNKLRKLVLTTGNKSEMAVGYATLYGDMAGGYAPLKDVSKTLVYRLCRWLNTQAGKIPERIIERPPTAELRHDQTDADSLPAYEVLDPILERYIEQDKSPQEIIAAGFNRDDVIKVTRLIDMNEYKRRQSAPGVKISKKAFGRERRYPITSGYREE